MDWDNLTTPLTENEAKRFFQLRGYIDMGVILRADEYEAYDEWLIRYNSYGALTSLAPLETMRQVALLYIYQNNIISNAQAPEIAGKHGFKSPTSGQKLCAIYNKLAHQPSDRTGVQKRGIRSMITDILAVIPHLDERNRQQAERELQTLRNEKNKPV